MPLVIVTAQIYNYTHKYIASFKHFLCVLCRCSGGGTTVATTAKATAASPATASSVQT